MVQAHAPSSEEDGAALSFIEPGAQVVLCADDFGMMPGINRGIAELAAARRLSATSAMVTLHEFAASADLLRGMRGHLATGLHLNLTVGAPLGEMPKLAPHGELPQHPDLVRRAVSLSLDQSEIEAEIIRQIERFEAAVGFAPDFVDGHQHVHALPGVRNALVSVLTRVFTGAKPLVRDPADTLSAIVRRGACVSKAFTISLLSRGFGELVRQAGFPTNHGFAGVSAFDTRRDYALELAAFFKQRGPRHLVMCHPGYVDPGLGDLDSVVERRRQELDALFAVPRLESAIWHVQRPTDGRPVDWAGALPV